MPLDKTKTPVEPSNYRTAIVLQGGGALGAYELGVLKAIYDQRPGFRPVAVSGISIGAVTAAVLGGARDDPIASLERLWREKLTVPPSVPGVPPLSFLPRDVEQSLAVFGNPGMYQFNPGLVWAPWSATSIYETGPLRQTLAELVDDHQLNYGGIRVIVGAIDVNTAMMQYFDNSNHDMTIDAVLASGSLPPSFPMTTIDGHRYWDGGLFSNTPLSPAINVLEACEPDNPDIYREIIVVELFPQEAPTPTTLPEVQNRTIQLQYTSRIKLDKQLSGTVGGWIRLFQDIQAALAVAPPTEEIRAIQASPEYREMSGHRPVEIKAIDAHLAPDLANAADFSRLSIDARIDCGYDDAKRFGVGW